MDTATTYTAVFSTEWDARRRLQIRYRCDGLAPDGDPENVLDRVFRNIDHMMEAANEAAEDRAYERIKGNRPYGYNPTVAEVEEEIGDEFYAVEIVTGLTLVNELPEGMPGNDSRIIYECAEELDGYRYAIKLAA